MRYISPSYFWFDYPCCTHLPNRTIINAPKQNAKKGGGRGNSLIQAIIMTLMMSIMRMIMMKMITMMMAMGSNRPTTG